jgi:Lon protease-like protein
MPGSSASHANRLVVPIFPLPDATLFPHTLLPLHVFEARYRSMVMDAMARQRRIAIVQLRPGYEPTYAGKPAVHVVAGVGEIVSCERLANGRFNILLRGEARMRIEREQPSDTLYRIVIGRSIRDIPPAGDVSSALTRIRAACGRLLNALERPPDLLEGALAEGQAPGIVADRIAAAVLPDGRVRQQLLETVDVSRRLDQLSSALEDLVNELLGGRP